MDKKEAFRQKLEAQLTEWKADIEKLKAKAKAAKADAEIDYSEFIEDLKEKQAELRKRLTDLEDSGGDAWKELRKGIEKAVNELKQSLKEARKKFD